MLTWLPLTKTSPQGNETLYQMYAQHQPLTDSGTSIMDTLGPLKLVLNIEVSLLWRSKNTLKY